MKKLAKKKTKKTQKRDLLPDKPSELILLALKDLAKVERQKKTYVVDMHDWHDNDYPDGKCRVCLAGAVMAGTHKLKPGEQAWSPAFYKKVTMKDVHKLEALDCLRCGDVSDASYELEIDLPNPHRFNRPISSYKSRTFKAKMKKLAQDLKKAGH